MITEIGDYADSQTSFSNGTCPSVLLHIHPTSDNPICQPSTHINNPPSLSLRPLHPILHANRPQSDLITVSCPGAVGRYVGLKKTNRNYMNICEIKAFGQGGSGGGGGGGNVECGWSEWTGKLVIRRDVVRFFSQWFYWHLEVFLVRVALVVMEMSIK